MLLAFLVLTGVLLPLVTRRLSRAAGRGLDRAAGGAARVDGRRHRGHGRPARARPGGRAPGDGARRSAREVDRLGDRLAGVRGLGGGLAAGLTSLCAVVVLAVAIPLVAGGPDRGGATSRCCPMVAIAAFEGVQPLDASVQQLDSSRAAGRSAVRARRRAAAGRRSRRPGAGARDRHAAGDPDRRA